MDRYESSELNQIEAADLLGVTERTFRRWCHRYKKAGDAELLDRRLGGKSAKRVPVDRSDAVKALYRTRFSRFTPRHFHEHLVREHAFSWLVQFRRRRHLRPKLPVADGAPPPQLPLQTGRGKTAVPVTIKERPEYAAFGEAQPCWST